MVNVVTPHEYPGDSFVPHVCWRGPVRRVNGVTQPERRPMIVIDHWNPAIDDWARLGDGEYVAVWRVPGRLAGWRTQLDAPGHSNPILIALGTDLDAIGGQRLAAGAYIGRAVYGVHESLPDWVIIPHVPGPFQNEEKHRMIQSRFKWLPLPPVERGVG